MSRPLAAWIHAHSVDDWWGHGHDRGRAAVQERFGAELETVVVDQVGEGAAWIRRADELAEAAAVLFVCDVTVGDALREVARRHPLTRFVHCQGTAPGPNIATFRASRDEHAFVSGLLAGAATRSGVLGLVEGVPSPHDLLYTNAWVLGARRSNPSVRVRVRWVGSYHDADQPQKDRRAVRELVAAGADVIGGNLAENPAVVDAAGEAGVFVTAHDERLAASPQVLDASYLDWRPYYLRSVAEVLEGTWRPRATRLGAADGVVRNTDPAAWLPAAVRDGAASARALLETGGLPIWRGPLHDASGRRMVAAGEIPSADRLDSAWLDWLIEGVDEL